MRSLFCLLAIASLACWCSTACLAQPGPATLENLVNYPDRAPLPPLAKDSEQPFPLIAPDAAAVKEAQDLIKQAYEDEYKASATNPEPLIQKLLAAAGQTKDPVRRYAYLISAEEAAVSGGDYGRTMELIDIRAAEFAIDGLQSQLERLAKFLTPKTKTDPEILTRLYEHAIETAERGVKQDSLEQAKAAAEMAASIAKSLYMAGKAKKKDEVADDGAAKQTQARALVKHIERRSGLFSEYQKALETIKTKEDSAANGVIGRYLCFEIDDWEKGLPFLAKGDQKDVAEVATLELEVRAANAKKPNAADIFTVAGEWWKVAEDVAESVPAPTKLHAAALYRSVCESLSDPLDQALAQKRGNDPAIGRMNLGRHDGEGKGVINQQQGREQRFKHFRLVAKKSNPNGFEAYYRTVEFYGSEPEERLQGGRATGTGNSPAEAFDDSRETLYRTVMNPGAAGDWIAYQLPKAITLTRVKISQLGFQSNHVSQIEVQGSNDGRTWHRVMIADNVPFEFDSANKSLQVQWVTP
jgi:hypothetical protein